MNSPHRFASDAAIENIARRFLDHSLPNDDWTHAAHFSAAFVLLRDDRRDALAEMPGLIRAYNQACGKQNTDTGGYHETITLASLRIGRAWLDARPGMALHVVLNELMDSRYGQPDWLLAHWSHEVLFSVAARRAWVEPNLCPLF